MIYYTFQIKIILRNLIYLQKVEMKKCNRPLSLIKKSRLVKKGHLDKGY